MNLKSFFVCLFIILFVLKLNVVILVLLIWSKDLTLTWMFFNWKLVGTSS